MTIVADKEDHRNLEWVQNNKGSMLLQKMGWTHGKGIGKRSTNSTTTALRALKRKESLGLGATVVTEGGNSESTGTFSAVLKQLQETHGTSSSSSRSSSKKKKKKKSNRQTKKGDNHNDDDDDTDRITTAPTLSSSSSSSPTTTMPTLTLAQNRCNAGRRKIRESKFARMSPADMAAVFGNKDFIHTHHHHNNNNNNNNNTTTMEEPAAVVVSKDGERHTSSATPPPPVAVATHDNENDSGDKKRKSKSESKKSKKDKKKRRRTTSKNDHDAVLESS